MIWAPGAQHQATQRPAVASTLRHERAFVSTRARAFALGRPAVRSRSARVHIADAGASDAPPGERGRSGSAQSTWADGAHQRLEASCAASCAQSSRVGLNNSVHTCGAISAARHARQASLKRAQDARGARRSRRRALHAGPPHRDDGAARPLARGGARTVPAAGSASVGGERSQASWPYSNCTGNAAKKVWRLKSFSFRRGAPRKW